MWRQPFPPRRSPPAWTPPDGLRSRDDRAFAVHQLGGEAFEFGVRGEPGGAAVEAEAQR
jgi:hypothetical protein